MGPQARLLASRGLGYLLLYLHYVHSVSSAASLCAFGLWLQPIHFLLQLGCSFACFRVALRVLQHLPYTHRYTMVQQYHKLCTKLLSVGNSLEAVVMPVFVPVYGSAHIHAVLFRVPARIWLCSNTQFWVWVVHGNSLSALFWFDGVPVGKVGRYQVVLLPWSTCPEFMSTFAIAWPPASAWWSSSSSPVLFFSSFPPHSRSFLRRRPDWGSWAEGVLWGQRT